VVAEVRIYIEGGGNRDDAKTLLRQGFSEFFRDLVAIARERNIGWRLVAYGSREDAYRAFQIALTKAHPTAFNVLLVDAEAAVEGHPGSILPSAMGGSALRVQPTSTATLSRIMIEEA